MRLQPDELHARVCKCLRKLLCRFAERLQGGIVVAGRNWLYIFLERPKYTIFRQSLIPSHGPGQDDWTRSADAAS